MTAKRVSLGLGVEKEETRRVLNDFYKLRNDLGYCFNVDLLAWLLRTVENRSAQETDKTSWNSDINDGPTRPGRKSRL